MLICITDYHLVIVWFIDSLLFWVFIVLGFYCFVFFVIIDLMDCFLVQAVNQGFLIKLF